MKETMIEAEVTYTLELDGRFLLIEHVPARICKETGEQFFSPRTVERLHKLVRSRREPDRVIQTPVYDFA